MSRIVKTARRFGIKPSFAPRTAQQRATELSIRAIKSQKAVKGDENRKQTLQWLRALRSHPSSNEIMTVRYLNKEKSFFEWTKDRRDEHEIINKYISLLGEMRRICVNERKEIQKKRQYARSKGMAANRYGLMRIGGVYQNAGSIFQFVNRSKIEQIAKSKEPKIIGERHFGIELEFICPTQERELRVELLPVADYIHLGSDGSIQVPRGYRGYEIRLCIPSQNLGSVIAETCRILKRNKAFVNKSCGMHVHMDMRAKVMQLDEITTDQVIENFMHSQAVLYSMQPESRRNNRYCKRITNFAERPSDRYHGINISALGKYSTIELRMHSATINATKITHWCDLLERILMHKGIPKNLKVPAFQKALKITGDLKKYMDERIERFGNLEVEDEEAEDGVTAIPTVTRSMLADDRFGRHMNFDTDNAYTMMSNAFERVRKKKQEAPKEREQALQQARTDLSWYLDDGLTHYNITASSTVRYPADQPSTSAQDEHRCLVSYERGQFKLLTDQGPFFFNTYNQAINFVLSNPRGIRRFHVQNSPEDVYYQAHPSEFSEARWFARRRGELASFHTSNEAMGWAQRSPDHHWHENPAMRDAPALSAIRDVVYRTSDISREVLRSSPFDTVFAQQYSTGVWNHLSGDGEAEEVAQEEVHGASITSQLVDAQLPF